VVKSILSRLRMNLLDYIALAVNGKQRCCDCHNMHVICPTLSGGTLNRWRGGDDGRLVAERLQVRF
jgi:hypothetical protein